MYHPAGYLLSRDKGNNLMCGIFGYVGTSAPIGPMVSSALRTMEYRGYDSWGIGWDDGKRFLNRKAPGRVPQVIDASPQSGLAIGHTRWATHGVVSVENAHPHFDGAQQIGVVHNGVIENVLELQASLDDTTSFLSQTDSEIVVHLVAHELASGKAFPEAVEAVFGTLAGSNAIVVANRATGEIAAITSRSPLRMGRRGSSLYLASDPLALADIADEMAEIPDHTLVTMARSSARLKDTVRGEEVVPIWGPVPADARVERGNHAHFTLKEIHDQPDLLLRLSAREEDVTPLAKAIRCHSHLILTGCGSAYYAATLGAEWLRQSLKDTWVEAIPASEIAVTIRNQGLQTLVLALTQSGETADVVDVLHVARSWGATTAALVNTESSTVATHVDIAVPLLAGTERSVLATKSFLAMVMRQLQLVRALNHPKASGKDESMEPVLGAINHWLSCERLNELARQVRVADHVLTLGKGSGHKVALEAALKIKEGSYVHAEAFLTGELKHGPLALVSENTPCLLFATTADEVASARIASREITSRGGFTVGIGPFDPLDCSLVLRVPDLGAAASLVHLVIAQRLAYLIALGRGVDPDFPRNLAKSVTVR
jgi:glucosamine--fructose-6-phosphate aminotransferase (isomerizing)